MIKCKYENCLEKKGPGMTGYCIRHYNRKLKGLPMDMEPILKKGTILERFEQKVFRIPESGCWIWTGCLDSAGYGLLRIYGKIAMAKAHRWSYEHFKGPIPVGLQIDHLCRVRCCVNPNHLEVVTQAENMRRGIRGQKWQEYKQRKIAAGEWNAH